jgi:hypothetical protein
MNKFCDSSAASRLSRTHTRHDDRIDTYKLTYLQAKIKFFLAKRGESIDTGNLAHRHTSDRVT